MKNLNKLVVYKIKESVYQLMSCPDVVENDVWGDSVVMSGYGETKYFHSSWLDKLKESCVNNNVEFEIKEYNRDV